MAQFFQIHPDNPQVRLIRQAADIVHQGGIIVYPTDTSYALGCHIGDKNALQRMRRIRQVDDKHDFTLACRDLAEIATYAKVDNNQYRLLKNLTPGAYTFINNATKQVPKRLLHEKKKTIGIRIPNNRIALELLDTLGEPMLTSTLLLPGDEYPLTDPYDMKDTIGNLVDLIIDGGYCGMEETTMIDLVGDVPVVLREGMGDISIFE
jgi:tRNA threonylcarbamoyl adenosine modification protein (Sua5/YciO/YrdC/YwlC family)